MIFLAFTLDNYFTCKKKQFIYIHFRTGNTAEMFGV